MIGERERDNDAQDKLCVFPQVVCVLPTVLFLSLMDLCSDLLGCLFRGFATAIFKPMAHLKTCKTV